MWAGRPRAPGCSPLPESLPTGTGLGPFQRPGRSLKADWLDERPTSNGAVRERVEPAHLGGRWFGAEPGLWTSRTLPLQATIRDPVVRLTSDFF